MADEWSQDAQDAVCEGIRQGLSRDAAFVLGGLTERQGRRWMDVGEGEDAPPGLAGFAAAVLRAEAELEREQVGVWVTAADWKAAMSYLERRFKRWRRDENAQVGPPPTPLVVQVEVPRAES